MEPQSAEKLKILEAGIRISSLSVFVYISANNLYMDHYS
jgi:hypothetical protein